MRTCYIKYWVYSAILRKWSGMPVWLKCILITDKWLEIDEVKWHAISIYRLKEYNKRRYYDSL